MSGLLDKANKVAGAETYQDSVHQGNNIVNDPDAIINAYEKGKNSGKADVKAVKEKTEKTKKGETIVVSVQDDNDNPMGLNINALKFQIGAVVGFMITMFLVFFIDTVVLFGDITLDDFFVPGVIVWWLVFNGDDLRHQELDWKKLGITAGCFLVVTGMIAGVAIFSAASSGVTIGEVEFDGDSDAIDLKLYGPKGMDYTIEVLVDGDVEYSEDGKISIDKASHEISLDEFWAGNAHNKAGNNLVEYEVKVTSDGGEDSMTFNEIMDREVDTAYVKVLEKYDNTGDDKYYLGIYVSMIVGIGEPGASFDFDNGVYTGTPPQPIESDWDATVRVLGGDKIHTYTFSADEGEGRESPGAPILGEFNFDWVSLHLNGEYLEKGDFYGSDGCYTFEITINNEYGEQLVSTDSQIRFYWDANEAVSDTSDDQPAEAC